MPALPALRALPWRLIGLGALALAFLGLIAALKIERAQNGKLQAQIEKCSTARQADRTSYETAQKAAAEKNRAQVQRIEAEQEKISHAIQSDLNARLERLRRELRQPGTPAAPGSSGSAPAGPDGKAPGGTVAAPRMCLEAADVLRGAENEERHEQLIRWVEEQLKVSR